MSSLFTNQQHNTVQQNIQSSATNFAGTYGVEFFHIYTDETIGDVHKGSLNYLKEAQKAWSFKISPIILIDNYNPSVHSLKPEEVFAYLSAEGFDVYFWAYEADMVENAKKLLDSITKPKLRREYESYIHSKGKLPCSLLTASWYLTRLGHLDTSRIQSRNGEFYTPVSRLVNILPSEYKEVEKRARDIILNSTFSAAADCIQDLFYPAGSHRKVDLF